SGVEAASYRPGASGRIIEFRARERAARESKSPLDEHHAVLQERCRMERSLVGEAAGCRPDGGGRIVEFGAREPIARTLSPFDEHHPVLQESCGMAGSPLVEAAGKIPLKR